MEKQDKNKVILLALASYFLAGFFTALSLQLNSIPAIILFYILSLALYLSGITALTKQYKKYRYKVYLVVAITGIALIVLITAAALSYII